MSSRLTIVVLSNKLTHSDYDWMNIFLYSNFIGKIRGKVNGKNLTIYTIMVFPEFQGHGYGEQVIDFLKKKFETIAADRVRFSAIGFWEKMGFEKISEGSFEYRKKV